MTILKNLSISIWNNVYPSMAHEMTRPIDLQNFKSQLKYRYHKNANYGKGIMVK
jgi:hypothetical protein